jgi:chromosome segregation ATPase
MGKFFMINAMKYIRNFVLVALSLQGSFVMAMDTTRMPFPQSFPVSLSSSKGGSVPVNLKLLTPFFNNLNKFDFSKINPYNIDLSGCKSFIADGITNTSDVVMNNPKKSLVAAVLVAACMSSYYCISREVISKERVAAIKAFLVNHAHAFGTSCFNILPNEAQGAILLLTRPFQMLGGMIMNYATHHKKYVGLTALFALGGRAAGWDGTGYTFAGIAFAYGAFASRFDRLEEQNDETHKQINALKEQIGALGGTVDQKIEGVSGQVTNVQSTVEQIQGGIGTLKNQLQQLDKDNKETAGQLQTQITTLEESLKKNLEDRLQVLSGELQKEISKVEVGNQEKADAIQKNLNELTALVNAHKLSNIEEFKSVRDFFTQSLSVLQVTLKEEMEQLRVEAASSKEAILQEINSVSRGLKELGNDVAEITVESKKIEGITSTLGTILDKTSSAEKVIELLQQSAKKLEDTSSQQSKNTSTLTTHIEGLREQLRDVQTSTHSKLETLVSDMEELKASQAAMKSEQSEMKSTLVRHGESIQSINSIVTSTDSTLQEQNRLLFERLKRSEETLEQVLEGQQALKTQLQELTRAGDKKVDELQSTLLSAISGSQENGQKKDRKRLPSSRKHHNNQRGDEQQVLQITFGASTPSNNDLINQMKQLNNQ